MKGLIRLVHSLIPKDYKNLMVDAMDNRDFKRALRIMTRVAQSASEGLATDASTIEKYIYIVTPTLLEAEPELTLELWKKNADLDVGKLLPALLNYLNPTKNEEGAILRSREDKLRLAVDCLEAFLLRSLQKADASSGRLHRSAEAIKITPAPLLKYLLMLYIMQGSEIKILRLLHALQERKPALAYCIKVATAEAVVAKTGEQGTRDNPKI
eukprot:scaffold602_cov298-Pinguiococcus_pyrenoidosus.AAC.15